MFNKLKQINDLRSKAKLIQDMLAKESVEGMAGWGGKVKITMNGNQKVTAVNLSDDALHDKNKLQDWIKEATNDAMEKIQKTMASKLKDMGGLDLAKDLQDMMGQSGGQA